MSLNVQIDGPPDEHEIVIVVKAPTPQMGQMKRAKRRPLVDAVHEREDEGVDVDRHAAAGRDEVEVRVSRKRMMEVPASQKTMMAG